MSWGNDYLFSAKIYVQMKQLVFVEIYGFEKKDVEITKSPKEAVSCHIVKKILSSSSNDQRNSNWT